MSRTTLTSRPALRNVSSRDGPSRREPLMGKRGGPCQLQWSAFSPAVSPSDFHLRLRRALRAAAVTVVHAKGVRVPTPTGYRERQLSGISARSGRLR